MKLSILIPSTYNRLDITRKLVSKLNTQIQDGVEIITKFDNKELSIGAKRQNMIEEANGEYVVHVDSDDDISDDYVSSILAALESKPDCVGFEIQCSGTKGKTASISNKWDKWDENIGGFDYVRTIYQKSPTKREIALKIGYKDMRFGEDADYSKRLKESGLLKTEEYIDRILYYYNFKYENPKTKYGFKRTPRSNNKRLKR